MVSVSHDLQVYNTDYELFQKDHSHERYHANLTIALGSTFLLDYQKDLLQELWGDIQDMLSDQDSSSQYIQKSLESLLHNFNTQLNIFVEKSKHDQYIDLRGIVQIWKDGYYISSLIGSTSLLIYRKQKLVHHIINHYSNTQKISLFSELVDGAIQNNDRIIILAGDISITMDESDLNHVGSLLTTDYNFADIMQDTIASRVDLKDFVYIAEYTVQNGNKKDFLSKLNMIEGNSSMAQVAKRVLANKVPVMIGGLIGGLIYFAWSVLSIFMQQNPELQLSQAQNALPSIGEIRQDINQFKNIDPVSDSKSVLYQNIVTKLNILEKANKWPNDINELKKIINQEFYKGFKITSLTDSEIKDSYIYTFDTEDARLGDPLKVLYHKTLTVVGSQGLKFGIVDNTYRGNMLNVTTPLRTCNFNILKNGYYCIDQMNTLTMITKGSQETVTTKDTTFPTMIQDIATYGKTNMYLLTKDQILNRKGVYVLKYNNSLGSQKDFGNAKEYSFVQSGDQTFATGFQQLAIDSTFLMWSPDHKKLYQFRRDKNADIVNSRVVKISGGNPLYKPLSSETQVITNANSSYIYFFDSQQQTLTIYDSSPKKNNENNTSTFNLNYVLRFDITSQDALIHATISDSDKPILYGLTKKGVIAIKIYEFIESFKHTDIQSGPSSSGLLIE